MSIHWIGWRGILSQARRYLESCVQEALALPPSRVRVALSLTRHHVLRVLPQAQSPFHRARYLPQNHALKDRQPIQGHVLRPQSQTRHQGRVSSWSDLHLRLV